MTHENEYKIIESKTWEIVRTEKDSGGYITRKVIYRIWPFDDGDWRLQVVDSDLPVQNVYIPEKVVEIIKRESVKKELRDDRKT